jgi:hypothetical protein
MLRRPLPLESLARQASSLMEGRFPEPSRMRASSASLTRNWRALAGNPAVMFPDDPSQHWPHVDRGPSSLPQREFSALPVVVSMGWGTMRLGGLRGYRSRPSSSRATEPRAASTVRVQGQRRHDHELRLEFRGWHNRLRRNSEPHLYRPAKLYSHAYSDRQRWRHRLPEQNREGRSWKIEALTIPTEAVEPGNEKSGLFLQK